MQPKFNYDVQSLHNRGRGRAGELPRRLGVSSEDLKNKKILEIGCGFGETTYYTRKIFDSNCIGIDPCPRWLNGPFKESNYYIEDSILTYNPENCFDYIMSYTVWEHIDKPREALEKTFDLLCPAGTAYLNYNLYRGASASHLLNYLDIPWMHLLYSDEEIANMVLAKHGFKKYPAWVNKLTYAHYLHYFQVIGFEIIKVWYYRKKIDINFLEEHKDKLSPYPIEDLEKNFMHVVIRRPK